MRLHEIRLIPKQPDDNPFDLDVLVHLRPYKNANVEGNKLLFTQHGDDLFFVIRVGEEAVAFAKATSISEPREALVINRTYVVPAWRNKGYMTALYRTLRGNGNVIISDIDLSPESISIWKKLLARYTVHIIDARSGAIKRKASLDDFDNDSADERLMLEEHTLFGKPVSESGMGIIRETEIFIGTNAP
jgi:GNAT superfamily N-acetyltransferase